MPIKGSLLGKGSEGGCYEGVFWYAGQVAVLQRQCMDLG